MTINHNWRKCLLVLTVLAAFALCAQAAFAQYPGAGGGPWGGGGPFGGGMGGHRRMGGQGGDDQGRQMRMDPDERLKRMTKDLKLTDEQQAKIKPILQDEQKQLQGLMGNSEMSQQEKRDKFRAIHESAIGEIRPILNEDQQKKFDKKQQEMQQRRGRGGFGGGEPGN